MHTVDILCSNLEILSLDLPASILNPFIWYIYLKVILLSWRSPLGHQKSNNMVLWRLISGFEYCWTPFSGNPSSNLLVKAIEQLVLRLVLSAKWILGILAKSPSLNITLRLTLHDHGNLNPSPHSLNPQSMGLIRWVAGVQNWREAIK